MGRMRSFRMALTLAVLAVGLPRVATAGSTLSVEPTRLTLDDEAYVTVTLEGDIAEYQAPAGDCFELSSPSQSTRLSIVNGRRSQSAELQYRLTPTKAGSCVVGPARVRTDRGWVSTNTVQIVVAKGAETPRVTAEEAQALGQKASEPFFVRPLVPTRALYPGEPFVLGYDLWVRADVGISDAGVSSEPSLPGFLSDDLLGGKRPKGHRQSIGRTSYVVYPLVRLLATPLQAGQTELGALEVQVVSGDVFRARRFKTKSPIVTLVVKPLPERERPPTFDAGSIGTFSLSGAVDKTRVSLGEALVYTLTLQGSGNLERLNAPPFPTVDGLTAAALPSGADDQVVKDLEGVHGVRRFQYVLRPTREGKLPVPPVRWTFFDPARQAFNTQETAPVMLDVSAALPTAAGGAAATTVSSAGSAPVADEALPLVDDPVSLDTVDHAPTPERALPLALLAALAVLVLGVEIAARVRRHRERHHVHYASARALEVARRALGSTPPDDPRAAQRVRAAIDTFLATRLQLEPGRLSLAELERALVERGLPTARATALRELLEALEQAAYLPDGTASMARLLDQALALLVEVDRG